MVDNRDELLYRAAQMYYVNNEKMDAIASALRVSRSTVSRILKEARESGIVRISLTPYVSSADKLSRELGALFSIDAHVVVARQGVSERQRMDAVARVAARKLEDWMHSGTTMGVAWGSTISAVVTHMQPQPMEDVRVVQLNGAANSSTTGIPYASSIIARIAESYAAETTFFPVPAFFDYPGTRRAMWQERSIQHVLELQRECDLALFGVGGLGQSASHVYSAGYLDERDQEQLAAQGVVGDVCTVLLREDGTYADIALNQRATGPTPRELRRIRRRVCVVAGDSKAPAIVGALRAGVATDLIIDDATARAVLKRVRPALQRNDADQQRV